MDESNGEPEEVITVAQVPDDMTIRITALNYAIQANTSPASLVKISSGIYAFLKGEPELELSLAPNYQPGEVIPIK